MRLDQYMAVYWPEYSRSVWQKYIKLGYVTVSGEIVNDPNAKLGEDDEVSTKLPEKTDYTQHTLPVLYEDDNVVVIDKPVGVLTHSKGELNDEFTVAEFFRTKTTYGTDTNRPGIVHRLDRDTSGVMIGAKNPDTAHLLAKQFQDRKTKKTYVAVLDGVPKEMSAVIDIPIGRNPKKPSQFKVDANGKSATTHYEVIRTDGKRTLVKLMPRTGRTHQLRVHMAHIGTPIHGDKVYGKAAERLYLHAWQLEITIPTSDRRTFTAEIPTNFETQVGK